MKRSASPTPLTPLTLPSLRQTVTATEINDLKKWLVSKNAAPNGIEPFLTDYGGGLSVRSTRSFAAGDVVISVPPALLLTSAAARETPIGLLIVEAASTGRIPGLDDVRKVDELCLIFLLLV